jgi:hypothetical protein
MDAVIGRVDGKPIEVLHMDVQGAELAFIRSMRSAVEQRQVRFVVVSTHHESISGSATTHEDCVQALQALGAKVFVEHDVFESYSGDGLIVAGFLPADRSIVLPQISRNQRRRALFVGGPSSPQATLKQGWLRRQVFKLSRSCRKRIQGGFSRRVA